MSDAEIIAENRRLGIGKKEAKGDMRFMQKYFHRGAFYQVRARAFVTRIFVVVALFCFSICIFWRSNQPFLLPC